jgi:hypothetical protein
MLLLALLTSVVWAADPAKSIDIADPAWGTFTIRVADAGKPAQDPIKLDLTLLCKDQRVKPTAALPSDETLINHDSICAFDRYIFDREKKVLTVQFSTSEVDGEEAKCQKHWKRTFEMKKLCTGWTKGV